MTSPASNISQFQGFCGAKNQFSRVVLQLIEGQFAGPGHERFESPPFERARERMCACCGSTADKWLLMFHRGDAMRQISAKWRLPAFSRENVKRLTVRVSVWVCERVCVCEQRHSVKPQLLAPRQNTGCISNTAPFHRSHLFGACFQKDRRAFLKIHPRIFEGI